MAHAGTLALSAVPRGVRGEIDRLTVDRDVYYTDRPGAMVGTSGAPCRLGAGEDYVIGDYAASSLDSRMRGPVPEDSIEGRVLSIYWPPTRWMTFE